MVTCHSVGNVESNVPSGYEESAQGDIENDDPHAKSEDEWYVSLHC